MPAKRKAIRILLVDDHPVVREGLRSILGSFEGISIAGEASSGREAIAVSREIKPDVILMDVTMPDMNGIDATAALTREQPECKILALSMHDNMTFMLQVLRAGARGYVLKDTDPAELVQTISEVFDDAMERRSSRRRNATALSQREVDVLRLIAAGLSNKQMGVALGLSVRTVETYRQQLIRKTGRTTVADLTRFAVTHGFLEVRPKA